MVEAVMAFKYAKTLSSFSTDPIYVVGMALLDTPDSKPGGMEWASLLRECGNHFFKNMAFDLGYTLHKLILARKPLEPVYYIWMSMSVGDIDRMQERHSWDLCDEARKAARK